MEHFKLHSRAETLKKRTPRARIHQGKTYARRSAFVEMTTVSRNVLTSTQFFEHPDGESMKKKRRLWKTR
jgi:hypothetical protein